MKIAKSVKKAMDTLGVDNPRRNQIRPVNAIRKGHDTMVIAPTSFGKSLIYLIPALIRTDTVTIVIEPLLALTREQVSKLISLGISAACLDSTQSRTERKQIAVSTGITSCRKWYVYSNRWQREERVYLEREQGESAENPRFSQTQPVSALCSASSAQRSTRSASFLPNTFNIPYHHCAHAHGIFRQNLLRVDI